MTRIILILTLAFACLSSACGSHESDASAAVTDPNAAPATPRKSDAIALSDEIAAQLGWHDVAEQSLPRNLVVNGKVQFNEDQTAHVLTPAPGQVVDLRVHIGDHVKAGDVLFSLRSREVAQLMTDYFENHRQLDLAEKTLAMTQDLFDHQAASKISLQQAVSDVAKQKAECAHAQEVLKILGLDAPSDGDFNSLNTPIQVRSPISGTIVERPVTAGQFVQPESGSLLTVADMSTVWVFAEVFERDVRFVQPGMRGDVTTTAYPDRKFTARVSRLNDAVDPETRTLKVRFLVSNPGEQLKPEMFASVSLYLADSERTLTVPNSAVFTEAGENYVFAKESGNQVRRQKVELGSDGGNDLRVINGLRAGDVVIKDGVLLVRELERNGA